MSYNTKAVVLACHLVLALTPRSSDANAQASEAISSWADLEAASKSTGVYNGCSTSISVSQGLLCEEATSEHDSAAEDRLNLRLTETAAGGVLVDGSSFIPADGRTPMPMPEHSRRRMWRDKQYASPWSYVTHEANCVFVSSPYRFDEFFYDSQSKRICVRLVHEEEVAKSVWDRLLFR